MNFTVGHGNYIGALRNSMHNNVENKLMGEEIGGRRTKISTITQKNVVGNGMQILLTLNGGLESLGLAEKSKEMMRSTPL